MQESPTAARFAMNGPESSARIPFKSRLERKVEKGSKRVVKEEMNIKT